jgi:nitrate reductase (NAD(P)H)
MIRLTGNHPLNCEYQLTELFEAGLTTPNEYHYIRQHGPVPHILWETHKLEVTGLDGNRNIFDMDTIKNHFTPINIQVALACDGNQRKELNMIKRSKGFNWAAGGVSCSFWKGPLLRDVLLATGILERFPANKQYWVNFEGADEPSEGRYSTCVPFEYAVDYINDVISAYEMNNVPLPSDHGYPLRVIVPGYVGGRNVKWVQKIWISEKASRKHTENSQIDYKCKLTSDRRMTHITISGTTALCLASSLPWMTSLTPRLGTHLRERMSRILIV